MQVMPTFQSGQRVHLVDKKGRQYAFTLKAGDRFQYSGETIPHDDLIGQPDGTMVRLSGGKTLDPRRLNRSPIKNVGDKRRG